jgi:RNA polymerase sigma-70 factor (ECF subfamily)
VTSDAELIGRSVTGDAAAFVELVRRHERSVGAYLSRRAGGEAAEELLGEVWLAAFASRSTYDRSFTDACPWLFGVARNTLRRHWRSLRPEEPLADMTEVAVGWDPWPAVDERVDVDTLLRSALMSLRPIERDVLTLVAWEDLSVVDAARALSIPAGSAYRHLHQARRTLQDAPGLASFMSGRDAVKPSK